MQDDKICITELSTSNHLFKNYHFCRGNNHKRKTRIGIILKGSGTYLYMNRKLNVSEGDIVFIPENIYCYSEWRGNPDIEVIYISSFMHYKSFRYEPQTINCDETAKNDLLQINRLLSMSFLEEFEAYSLFYKVLQSILPVMKQTDIFYDKSLQTAIEFITDHWNSNFSVGDLAKKCCISESTLYHLFKTELGQTPIRFLNSIKINIAIDYLENSNYSIATISRLVCFHSENHFRKVFVDITGITPLKYRKRK